MAISLVNDVIKYCTQRGSRVHACSLDAEGAFDAIPHSILFGKASGVIPDQMWRILVDWYSDLKVYIKWNNSLSDGIQVLIGTRQGGLSSPFLFNLFDQQLINILNCTVGGILINDVPYNVFCYADDLILTSTSVTGLQKLINCANDYIVSHGLRFNPTKTQCATFGRKAPQTGWYIGGAKLAEADRIQYLIIGAVI